MHWCKFSISGNNRLMRNNWDDFRFFLAVARHGTLSRAGFYLGVDHATVGRRITALEDSLGVPLFHRSPQGYSLADQGYKMLPLAEQLESDAMRVFDEVAGASTSLTGALRIATHVGIASFLLPEISAELRRCPTCRDRQSSACRPARLSELGRDSCV